MSIKLEAGQWYRNRDGEICYCIGKSKAMSDQSDHWFVETETAYCETFHTDGSFLGNAESKRDLIEHLPDCTGFDWEPPKPVVAPEGWRLLTEGETVLATDQWWEGRYWQDLSAGDFVVGGKWNGKDHYPMARKIDPKYRPFANAEEFKPYRDKWIQRSNKYDTKETIPNGCFRVMAYNDHHVWTSEGTAIAYETLFNDGKKFEDGSPFGVRVDD